MTARPDVSAAPFVAPEWGPIMTDTQLAKALGWDRRRLKRQGWPCTKSGNDWVYVLEDVIRYLRKYGRAA